MIMTNSKMRSTAIAALLSFPLATGVAVAQQSQGTSQTQPSTAQAQQQSSQSGSGQPSASGQASDAVVATVGSAEILGSDVMTVIGLLPPQLQSQPPQMLVPMALQQLILRELVLEDARSQNFAEDPEVVALVESSSQTAEEDAMVQVWIDREMANVVTDEAVQGAYADAQAQGQENLPPIDEVRPQIEQFLRQQAMQDIQARLQRDADIVLFDATGQPIEQQQGDQTQQGQGAQGTSGSTGNASGGQSTGTSDSPPSEGATGSSDTSGTTPPKN